MDQNNRAHYQIWIRHLLLLLALLGSNLGCNRQPTQPPITGVTYDQLYRLQNAYLEFCDQRNKAPKSPQDLKAILEKSGQASTVIDAVKQDTQLTLFWGYRPDMKSPQPIVIGYKPSETELQYVVMTQHGIVTMDATELQSAAFPPDQSAPKLNPNPTSN